MILVADSGSTKTSWRIISADEIIEAETKGLNPYYQGYEQIRDEINLNLISQVGEYIKDIDEIHFYGAGCSSYSNQNIIKNALEFSFPGKNFKVEHDLLAAARSLCGTQPGIAGILGTGSNSCEYDGKDITLNIPSLGYVMGDEGSGTHLGKLFLSDYMRKDQPQHIMDAVFRRYKFNKDTVLERVYQEPHGNRFLAGLVPFIKEHMDDAYVYELIKDSFTQFFEKYLMLYKGADSLPIHFTGSVAFYMQKPLKDVAKNFGVSLKSVIANPIDGLIEYHKNN